MIEKIREKKPKIAVVGDLMIDHYIWGNCERISPEAPVQVVSVDRESAVLGGAGNVLNNLVSLGASASIFSVIGEDAGAGEMMSLLDDMSLGDTNIVSESARATTKKSRIIASNQQILRYDTETIEPIKKSSEDLLFGMLEDKLESFDLVLLSDYGKGVLSDSFTRRVIKLVTSKNKSVLVDPKGADYSKYKGASLLTPNKKEAMIATGMGADSLQSIGESLRDDLELDAMIITLSEDGMALFEDEMRIIPTVAREVYDVTGAGDTVLASLGVAIGSGVGLLDACEFANKAAAVVVAKVGSATVTLNEIEEYEHIMNKGRASSKVKNLDDIKRISTRLKEQGRRVVFTNGCFDILHRGHTQYLEQAKVLGDALIVGLNSDASVTRLKGESRPVNTLEDRALILAGLESVDYVVEFAEETPIKLIEAIEPDILVKGADYQGKDVVGSEVAGQVVLIDFVDGKSTTKLIEKISKRT